MGKADSLEARLQHYKKSVGLGQLLGLAASTGAAFNLDKIASHVPGIDSILKYNLDFGAISQYSPGIGNFLGNNLGFLNGVNIGAPLVIAGANFIGDQIGFAASLYALNRSNYKGLKGKLRFIKDFYDLGIRHLGSYAITYPAAIGLTALLTATGVLTGPLALIVPYVIESLFTFAGYIFSTKGIRKKAPAANPSPQPISSPTAQKPAYTPKLSPAYAT